MTIQLVQSKSSAAGAITSLKTIYASAPTQNSLLVAAVTYKASSTLSAAVGWSLAKDEQAGSATDSLHTDLAIYYKVAGAGESATSTWALDVVGWVNVVLHEFSGVNTASASVLDKTAAIHTDSGSSTARLSTSTTLTVSQANQVLVAAWGTVTNTQWSASRTYSASGSNFIESGYIFNTTSNVPLAAAYRTGSTVTSYNVDFSWSATGAYGNGMVAAFNVSASATTTTNTLTPSLDGLLQKTVTKTASLDGLLNKTVSATYSLDSLLQNTVTKAASLDSLLQNTVTKTASLDSLLQNTVTKTVSLDGLLQNTVAKTESLDALLQKTVTTSISLDAVLSASATTTTKTLSLDSLLNKTVSATLSIDGLLQNTVSKTVSLDGLLQNTVTKTASFDGLLGETVTKTASLDAVLDATATATTVAFAYLYDDSGVPVLDENGDPIFTDDPFGARFDGVLVLGAAKTVSYDGLLQKAAAKTLSLDSLLGKTVTKAASLDGVLIHTQNKTVSLDALLAGNTTTKTISLDAVLADTSASTRTKTVSFDALKNKTVAFSYLYDDSGVPVLAENGDPILTDNPFGVAFDAVLSTTTTGTSTNSKAALLDGLLKKTATQTVSLDSHLQKHFTKTLSLDGFLNRSNPRSLFFDALLSRPRVLFDAHLIGFPTASNTTTISIDGLLLKTAPKATGFDGLLEQLAIITDVTYLVDDAHSAAVELVDDNITAIVDDNDISIGPESDIASIGDATLADDTNEDIVDDSGSLLAVQLDIVTTAESADLIIDDNDDFIIIDEESLFAPPLGTALDALLQKANTSNVSLDALLQRAGTSGSVGFDAILGQTRSKAVALDALLQKAASKAVNFNAVTIAAGTSLFNAAFDGLLLRHVTKAVDFDASLEYEVIPVSATGTTSTSLTVRFDSRLQKFIETGSGRLTTVSFDGILFRWHEEQPDPAGFWRTAGPTISTWHSDPAATDGFWDGPDPTAVPTATATAVPAPTPITFTTGLLLDANLAAITGGPAITFGLPARFDALLDTTTATATASVSLNIGLDSLLAQVISFASPIAYDAMLARQAIKTVRFDAALISAATTLLSARFDGLLTGGTRTTISNSIDGLLFKGGIAKSMNLDATLLKTVQSTALQPFDGILMKQFRLTAGLDGVLTKATRFAIPVAFNALLQHPVGKNVALDALLQLQVPTTGADAVLTPETTSGTRMTKSVSLDAKLQLQAPTVGADAVLTGGAAAPLAFPGAVGFGSTAKGGRGGTLLHVTSLADTNTGSGSGGTLRWCIGQNFPRIIVFDVGGTITLTSKLVVGNPFVTIAGETAPSPGIELIGNQVSVRTREIICRHISFRSTFIDSEGDSLEFTNGNAAGPCIFDHCTFQWGGDGTVDIWSDVTLNQNITLQDCFIFESLTDKNFLIKGSQNITAYRVYMAYSDERHPRIHSGGTSGIPFIGTTTVEVINCCSYNGAGVSGSPECFLGSDSTTASPVKLSFQNNWYVAGANTVTSNPLVKTNNGAWGGGVGQTQIYFNGNANPNGRTLFVNQLGFNPLVATAPVDSNIPSAVIMTAGPAFESDLLTKGGSRPLDRDTYTTRCVNKIIARAGTNQLSVSGYGGHSNLGSTSSPFVPVANPNGDDDSDGYTNIEEQLHALSSALIP